ncbi:MAG: DUF3786 domain-containing protein [Ignisphaera sp.]
MCSGYTPWWKEVWGWDRVKDVLRTLPGRLGFERNRYLRFFRLRVDLESGEVFDEVLERFLSERERYGLYYVLYNYAQTAIDIGESREYITLTQICPAVHCPMVKQNIDAFKVLVDSVFSSNPDLLYKAAETFNYEKIDFGDAAVKVYTLPRVPIVVAIWFGEEGMPSSVSLLYDKNVSSYLECEAASIMGGVLLARLIISLGKSAGIDISNVRYGYRYQCPE